MIDVGRGIPTRSPVVLRLAQLERVLGIKIPTERVRQVLSALGNEQRTANSERIEVIPPSWRRDLTREIDLIEEVARIHGYEAIPEDVKVPMAASARRRLDRVLSYVREALIGAGVDEALTLSAVEEGPSDAISPWTNSAALQAPTPILKRADRLRRSLMPSLLLARRNNEAVGNERIELFEIAPAYWPRAASLPQEELLLCITSGGDYLHVKGIIEGVLTALKIDIPLGVTEYRHELFKPGRAAKLSLDGQDFGFIGEVSEPALKRFELRGASTVAEVNVAPLEQLARLIPKSQDLSPYPAVSRDLNLVVDESVRWADVERTVQAGGAEALETVRYLDTYRDAQRVGAGRKSLIFSMTLRGRDGTLTSAEADAIRDFVVASCEKAHRARLRT